MPRTGGVFSLLSGSKGTPNTTIQSAPYNAQLDDFAQDANVARPITAGGTGATNASSARTNLGLAIGSDVQAFDAGLLSIAGLTTAANLMIYATAADVYATTALTPFARTILDDADAATVRATLGLGSVATQNTVPVENGGTGATSASAARTNLGLAIGTDVQAFDDGLQSIAGLATAADRMIYTTALDAYAVTPLTAFARTILDDANAAAVRTTLGLGTVSTLNTVPVANGGTGSTTVAAAQAALSLDNKVVYATKSANYTALAADNNAVVSFSVAATMALTAAATLAANWHVTVVADGGDVIIDPSGSETIDGALTVRIPAGSSTTVVCTGTAFFTTGLSSRGILAGYISPDFNLSNNVTDAVNDINFPAGVVASGAAVPMLMTHAAGTAQLDVAWNTGTGGRFDSAISDGWWHCFIISNGSLVNRGFSKSLNPTSQPNYPAGYNHYRRVASWPRLSGSLAGMTQRGDDFTLTTYAADRNSTAIVGSGLLTLTVPVGITVQPKMALTQEQLTTGNIQTKIASAGETTSTVTVTKTAGDAQSAFVGSGIFTNTSSQIQFEVQSFGGSLNLNVLSTMGWIDTRGIT